jgi:pyruvate/2-oxoglutarate dehydrogenase complex dihydrolipoamide dehydrogenase (E3) component
LKIFLIRVPESRKLICVIQVSSCGFLSATTAPSAYTQRRFPDKRHIHPNQRTEIHRCFGCFFTCGADGSDAMTDEIVGATLVAAHAGEMISELTMAITNKLPMKALAETVHCYPTQAEVFQRIALAHGK